MVPVEVAIKEYDASVIGFNLCDRETLLSLMIVAATVGVRWVEAKTGETV